jgi:cytoskeletal protein RodZ
LNNHDDLQKYYDILEIDGGASLEEITSAYTYLKELYSSDSVALLTIEDDLDDEKKAEILTQIEEAYQILSSLFKEREPVAIDLEEAEEERESEVKEIDHGEKAEESEVEDIKEAGEEEVTAAEEIVEEKDVDEDYQYDTIKEREIISIDLEEEEKAAGRDIEEDSGYSTDLERRFANILGMEDTIAEDNVELSIITGKDLKEIREQMGMGIHELESRTKIPYKTLVYIEKEKFEKLSDPGYLRWYITQFAKALNLDPKETANQYMKRFRNWEKKKNK